MLPIHLIIKLFCTYVCGNVLVLDEASQQVVDYAEHMVHYITCTYEA
jgi:hypothetical protein